MPYTEALLAAGPRLRVLRREGLMPGGLGARQELLRIRELIRQDAPMQSVRELAKDWIRGAPPMNKPAYARAILAGLSRSFHYVPDGLGAEELIAPEALARTVLATGRIEGDCKKNSLLAGAVARAVRLRVKLSALAIGSPLGPLRHVRAFAHDGRGWISLDVSYRKAKPARPPIEMEV